MIKIKEFLTFFQNYMYICMTQPIKTNMERNELYNIVDEMTELMGHEQLLDALIRAMSSDELESNLRYIDRVYDLDLFIKL